MLTVLVNFVGVFLSRNLAKLYFLSGGLGMPPFKVVTLYCDCIIEFDRISCLEVNRLSLLLLLLPIILVVSLRFVFCSLAATCGVELTSFGFLFRPLSKALSFFTKFKDAGILHNNPKNAALFLNKNISSIDMWWQSRKIREIINIFKREYCVDNKYSCELLVKKIL
jgi:hypothetical protein